MYSSLNHLLERYPALAECENDIIASYNALQKSFENQGKLLICGNGGSAADSDHIAGELLKGFGHARPLPASLQKQFGPELASHLQGALPTIPLSQLAALHTAYQNDCDGTYTFAQLTFGLGKAHDTLLCISTSGNSVNICHAAKVARAQSMTTIALTGKTGGKLLDLVDHCIRVPETEVYKIQEYHLPIYHTLCFMLEDHFFPASS